MSELERRIRNGKVRWVARYSDPDGVRRAKTFDRKVDAQRLPGAESRPRRSPATMWIRRAARSQLGVWADKWLKTQGHLKPSTLARYQGIVAKHIRPRWGTTPLAKIDARGCRRVDLLDQARAGIA